MNYPSDITRKQFEIIRPILESARKRTKPRTLDLFDVFNGLLYVIKTGCQWRMLPSEYPKWQSVHAYFMKWSKVPEGRKESVLAEVQKKIGRAGAYKKWKEVYDQLSYR